MYISVCLCHSLHLQKNAVELSIFSTHRAEHRKICKFSFGTEIKGKTSKKTNTQNNEATMTKQSEFVVSKENERERIMSWHARANEINRIPVKHRETEINDTKRNKNRKSCASTFAYTHGTQ